MRMNTCTEFEIVVRCNQLLRISVFINEFVHFKIVFIFQLENCLRFINGGNLLVTSSFVFKHLMARFKATDIGCR